MRPRGAPTRSAPTVIGDWSDRAARNRPSSGRLEVAPPGLRNDPARNWAGLSISGAHRVAAVERLVGATLVVALPRTALLSAGHCLGTIGPGGVERRLSRGTMRPRRASTRGAPTVIGDWSDRAARNRPSSGRLEVAPPGLRNDPARNRAGIVHQRRPPRCRCRTTRRGDPCGCPPPNGATVRRPLLGHYRTGGVERRLRRGTMRPRRAPTRGAPTKYRRGCPQGASLPNIRRQFTREFEIRELTPRPDTGAGRACNRVPAA